MKHISWIYLMYHMTPLNIMTYRTRKIKTDTMLLVYIFIPLNTTTYIIYPSKCS